MRLTSGFPTWRFQAIGLTRPLRILASILNIAIITLTHDPKLDDPALQAAVDTDAFFIGALGRRKTHAQRLERLRSSSVSEKKLTRIHAPVGPGIGAKGPAEIAMSVMSQIIEQYRCRLKKKFSKLTGGQVEGATLAAWSNRRCIDK